MDTKINLMDRLTDIKITDAGWQKDNFHTIEFTVNNTSIGLELSDPNYNELGQQMFPQGLIPDGFHEKVAMLNKLIEELDDIRDIDNKDYKLSKVTYDSKNDRITCDFEEVEEDVDPREFDE